jgi:hypothetical protein
MGEAQDPPTTCFCRTGARPPGQAPGGLGVEPLFAHQQHPSGPIERIVAVPVAELPIWTRGSPGLSGTHEDSIVGTVLGNLLGQNHFQLACQPVVQGVG